MSVADLLKTGAILSPDRRYRYLLWRTWDTAAPVCAFVGLNPSTADETEDDPTVRRCINYAKRWEFGSLWMLNAYAFRATDPRAIKAEGINAIGPENDEYLRAAASNTNLVVAAWGAHIDDFRERQVRLIFERAARPLRVLGLTLQGKPRHPLYLRADLEPMAWQ